MTGYGKDVVQLNEQTVTVEMRSVNHRFLDITLKMPGQLMFMEEAIKKIVKQFFHRGKIEIYIRMSGQGGINKNLQVDWRLLDQYMEKIHLMKDNYKLDGEVSLPELLSLPDLFEVQEEDEPDQTLKEKLIKAIENACSEMLEMRKTEGAFLKEDITGRLVKINELTEKLETVHPEVTEEYKERIMQRIQEHLDGLSGLDEARLHQEIAILAEKGNITEEIVRLKSHIEHMEKTLEEPESIGRKLDFICQEMHREANTIGAKSSDKKLSEYDVLLKSEIEKIKEQVQNIE